MSDTKPNEAALRANDPADRPDISDEEVRKLEAEAKGDAAPVSRRSEGAEMAPEIDEVDGEE